MTTYDRRLIEDSLPLEIISEQSAREKSIRHGHISTLHIWWARRPLAAMRAAIFASLIPAPKDDDERAYLHKLIGDIVNWDSVKDGNNARVEEARALIRLHYPDAPPKVLDPFMGGGSTGLEALRLGAEAHGVELNPVAYLIQLCTLVYPQKYGQPKTIYPEPSFTSNPASESALTPNPSPQGRGEEEMRWSAWNLIPETLLERAREMRKQGTSAEAILWECLRNRQLMNTKFRRQHPLPPFVVDFYADAHKLVVEVDGSVHDGRQIEDAERQAQLEQGGLRVLRFSNERVYNHLQSVLSEIAAAITPLSPGERGGGEGYSDAERGGGEGYSQLTLDMPTGEPTVIQNPLAEDVRKWGLWVLEEARKEIGHLYEDPEGRTIVAYLWARTAQCPNPTCGAQMPMVRQWWLAKTTRKKVAIRMNVDKANKQIMFDVAEGDAITFDPDDGTMKRGTIVCPVCGTSPADDHLKVEGKAGRLGAVLMSVVYAASSGKAYRAPTDADRARFAEAQALLDARLQDNPDALPYEPLPNDDHRNVWVVQYGLDTWEKLFNTRQALALITFVEKVRQAYKNILESTHDAEYAKVVATYLAIIFDKIANQTNTLSKWDNTRDNIQGVYSRQALPMVWDYVEANPFGDATGGWSGSTKWVIRVVDHAASMSIASAQLRQGDAARLTFSDLELDAVITDPPYYDAISYSNLSDFFYVWQKRSIGHLYPELFATPATPKSAEIIQDPERQGGQLAAKAFYETQMTKAFSEAQRVLKPDGIFVVVFAHKSTAAWETLLNSLLSAGLVVSASWPLNTEMSTRLRAQDSAALSSSIFIVCRKRAADEDGFYDDVRRAMTARIQERLDFFWSQGIRGADFFISAIGPAVEEFGRFKAVRKLSGDVVSVADLLDLVQEAVADYTLSRVLNGRYKMGTVDAPTRFYVMYRWSYGNEKLLFDDARRLAQALGAEVSALVRSGVLKQSGDSVTMPSANDRKKQEHLGEAGHDNVVPSVIDVLHRAVLVWQEGDRRALAEYLAQHALGREDVVNAVAQALVNVLPQGDRERQLLENYLQGSSDLPNVAQQPKLM